MPMPSIQGGAGGPSTSTSATAESIRFVGDIKKDYIQLLREAIRIKRTLPRTALSKVKYKKFSLIRVTDKKILLDPVEKKGSIPAGTVKRVKSVLELTLQIDLSWEVKDVALVKQRKQGKIPLAVNRYLKDLEHENIFTLDNLIEMPMSKETKDLRWKNNLPDTRFACITSLAKGDLHTLPSADFGILLKRSLQILTGLKFLHDRRFVHQDLKPENFFVFIEGDKEVVKIGDCDDVAPIGSDRTSCSIEYCDLSTHDLPLELNMDIFSMGRSLLTLYHSCVKKPSLTIATNLENLIANMTAPTGAIRPTVDEVISNLLKIEASYYDSISSVAVSSK